MVNVSYVLYFPQKHKILLTLLQPHPNPWQFGPVVAQTYWIRFPAGLDTNRGCAYTMLQTFQKLRVCSAYGTAHLANY